MRGRHIVLLGMGAAAAAASLSERLTLAEQASAKSAAQEGADAHVELERLIEEGVVIDLDEATVWGTPEVITTTDELDYLRPEYRDSRFCVGDNPQLAMYAAGFLADTGKLDARELRSLVEAEPRMDPYTKGRGKMRGTGMTRKSGSFKYKGSKAAKKAGRKRR